MLPLPSAKLAITLHPAPLAGSGDANATGGSVLHKKNSTQAAHAVMGHPPLPIGRGKRSAFSLVELSIVLVILGLLTGGILGGQSLIRAAELRSVTTDLSKYVTATYTFRDKYFAIPGDMNNAESFWGRDANCATTYTGTTAQPGTCNGNGNGQITTPLGWGGNNREPEQAWKQLALAGLIEGQYTGFSGATEDVAGIHVPKGKISNTEFEFGYYDISSSTSDPHNFILNYGNQITFSVRSGIGPLKPEEAWNIDTKLDDGKPGQGRIISTWYDVCSNAANSKDYGADYLLSGQTTNCALRYKDVAI